MADKNNRDFEIPVTLGETDVVVIVRSNDDVRKRRDDLFSQMTYLRGLVNPQMINMLDDDVKRILKTKGVDVNNLKGGTKEKTIIKRVTRAVQSFHMENRNATFLQATVVAMLEDIFEPTHDGKVRPKLRPDVASLVPNDVIIDLMTQHFADSNLSEEDLRFVPEPIMPDESVPAEKLYVLAAAVMKMYPEIAEQLTEGRERMAMLDAESGGVETDSFGFQSPAVD